MTIYYETFYGDTITSDDLEKAFFIVTGTYPNESKKAEKEFWKFREKCFGKSIRKTIKPSVDYFLINGNKIKAIKYYREAHGCSIVEAKNAVEEYIVNNENYRSFFTKMYGYV